MTIDVRGHACPLNWVKTRIALDRLAEGERLEVWLGDGEPVESVPRTAAEEGHRVVRVEPLDASGGGWRVVLEKGAAAPAWP